MDESQRCPLWSRADRGPCLLVALDHGGPPATSKPVVALGVFLGTGFTPAALTYLADVSRTYADDRGC
jgi:hypothetical protein